jgi:ribose 5-phosphate isomerase A
VARGHDGDLRASTKMLQAAGKFWGTGRTMNAAAFKTEAARAALDHVEDGMKLGIGTGSTAEAFVRLLAEKVADGLKIVGVPTSERTAALCDELGVPLSTLEELPRLDLTVDGADEIGPGLMLVKGGGGALLREKIVAAASDRMIVIADASKRVDMLGRFPLPIEVNLFGRRATLALISEVGARLGLEGPLNLREGPQGPFVTDGGHNIVDASFGRIPDPRALSQSLHAIPGVVEHGLFIDLADMAILAGEAGIETLHANR